MPANAKNYDAMESGRNIDSFVFPNLYSHTLSLQRFQFRTPSPKQQQISILGEILNFLKVIDLGELKYILINLMWKCTRKILLGNENSNKVS